VNWPEPTTDRLAIAATAEFADRRGLPRRRSTEDLGGFADAA
jgi:hypothetical protein